MGSSNKTISYTIDIGADITRARQAAEQLQTIFKKSFGEGSNKSMFNLFSGLEKALDTLERKGSQKITSIADAKALEKAKNDVVDYFAAIEREGKKIGNLGGADFKKRLEGLGTQLANSAKAWKTFEDAQKSANGEAEKQSSSIQKKIDDNKKLIQSMRELKAAQDALGGKGGEVAVAKGKATRLETAYNSAKGVASNKTRIANQAQRDYEDYIKQHNISLTESGSISTSTKSKAKMGYITDADLAVINQYLATVRKLDKEIAKLEKTKGYDQKVVDQKKAERDAAKSNFDNAIKSRGLSLTATGDIDKASIQQNRQAVEDQISEAQRLGQAWKDAAKDQQEAQKKMAEAQTQAKQARAEADTKEATFKANADQYKAYNDQLKQNREAINQSREALRKFINEASSSRFDQLKEALRGIFGDEFVADIENSEEGLEKLKGKLDAVGDEKMDEARARLQEFFNAFKEGEPAGKSVKELGDKVNKAGQDVQQLTDRQRDVENFISRFKHFFSLTNGFMLLKRSIRDAINTIKELDAVMTQTAVVSENTVGDMWKTLPEYSEEAKKLGAAIKDVYSAQTLYVQQGLDMNSAMDLGVETLKMARVAGIDAAAATDTMTAALRGFKMELNETSAVRINDVYSKLAQNTASNVQEISTAMTKVAALANSANMSFENTAAFLAKIIESTREGAETAGTALKTVIARFTEVKKLYSEGELTGTDEEGQEVDVNKISAALRTAGIDMNAFFTGAKGLDEIFIELGSKWDSLTTVQQRYIATMAAGSRQQSRFLALMQDFSRTTELTGMAYNSAGSGQEQFEKTLESLESKLNKLKDAWQTFIMGIANSDVVKGFIDTGTKILETINNIINSLSGGNGLIKSILSVAAAVGVFKAGGALLKGGLTKVGTLIGLKEGKRDGEQYKAGFMSALQGANGLKGKASAGANFMKQKGQSLIGYNKNGANLGNKLFQKETTTTNFKNLSDEDLNKVLDLDLEKGGHVTEDLENYNNALSEFGPNSKEAAEAQQQLSKSMQEVGISEEEAAKMTTETTTKMSTDFSKVGMAASTAGMLIAGIGSVLEDLGLEEAGGALKKFGTAFAAIGGIVVLVGQMITAAGIESQLAWWWVLLIVAALAALVVIVSAVAKQIKAASLEERMKKAAEATKEATEEAKKAREAYDELVEDKNKYKELQGALDDLVEGTDAFKEALINANQQVIDLIGKYSILAGYVSKGKYGQLIIDEEGFDKLLEQQQKGVTNANAAVFSAKAKELELKNEQITGSGRYGLGTIAGNAVAGSVIGATAGMLLGPIGSMIGGALGAYFSAKNTADQQIYTSKAFKKFQNSEDSSLNKNQWANTALKINGAAMLIPSTAALAGTALPITGGIAAINRQISKKQDQKRFKTVKDAYDQYGIDLLTKENASKIEELAKSTDMSVDSIRNLISALQEDQDAIDANNEAIIAMNKSMLDAKASDKAKEYEYIDAIEELFAKNMKENVTEAKIKDYEEHFLYQGQASAAARYGESTYGTGTWNVAGLFTNGDNSQWKGGAGKSEERADYLADKYAEYGVTRDQLTGKYLHDMQVVYAAMKGISVEDIGDGIKEDKTALGREVARMTLENDYAEKMDAAVDAMQKFSDEEQKTFAGLLTGNASSFSKKELQKIWVTTKWDYDNAYYRGGESEVGKSYDASILSGLAKKAGFKDIDAFAETLGYVDKNWSDLSEDEKYKYARQYINNSNMNQQSKDEYLSMSKDKLIEAAGNWSELNTISAADQLEWDAWQNWQTMQKAYQNASENLQKKGIKEDQYIDYSIETVTNLSKQVSQMGNEQGQEYVEAFNKVLNNPSLSEEQKKNLETLLSSIDLTSMASLTSATEEMFAAGLDINVIEAYWDAAVAGSGAYVHNLQEALSLGNQIQNNMSKATDREKRLSEGNGTFEDVQRALDLGIDPNLLHRTANGWVMEEEGIKQYQEVERERAAFESRNQADANRESVKNAKEAAGKEFFIEQDEETGKYKFNDKIEAENLKTYFRFDPRRESRGDYIDRISRNSDYFANALGISKEDFASTYFKDGKIQADLLSNNLKEILGSNILEPANQDEKVQEILDKDAEFYDIWKQTGSADAIRAQGYNDDTQRWAAISEATEKGLDVATLKDYAEHIQQITDLEAGMAHTIALDNMIMNEGIKDLASNFEAWEKALENPGTEEYSQSIEGLRTSMQKITGSSHKFSENFLKDTKTLELFKKAAEGDTDAINDLRKAGAKDILNLDSFGEAGKELNDLIDNLDLDEIKIGATLDEVGLTNAFQALLDAGLLTAEQVNQALETIGFEPQIDWVEADGGSWDEMHTKYTVNGQTYSADSVTESNGKVMIPVINGEGSTYKGGANSTVNASNRKGGGGGGGGGGEFENDFDKYYNMVEDINELQRLRNLLETDYKQLLDSEAASGKAIYDNLKKQVDLLKERRDITADLAEKRKGQIFDLLNDEEYKDVKQYAWWNEEDQTIEIDWDAINDIKDSETGDKVKELVSKLEDLQGKYDEQIEALEEIESTLQEIEKRGRDQYTSLEDRVRDALIQQIQTQIDELTAVNEGISDANQKLFDSIQNTLELQRQERDNAKTEEELSDKEQRLAYLQQDSSGANDVEIAQLQKELEDARESYTDQLIDQKISELQKQNDEAAEQRQEQIDLLQQSLDWQEKNGEFWEQAYQLMNNGIGPDGTLVTGSELEQLLKQGEGWQALSAEGKMNWLSDLETMVAEAVGYLYLSRQLEKIGTKAGTEITFTDAEGNTHTGKVDKDGNVVIDNGDGTQTVWKDVYQSYDGSYRTLETEENAKTENKPATSTSGSTGDTGGNKDSGDSKGTGKDWSIEKSGSQWVVKSAPNKGQYATEAEAKSAAYEKNKLEKIWGTKLVNGRYSPYLGGGSLTFSEANSIASDLNAGKNVITPYATGGLNTKTGPAWLDGTKSHPELVLNARDTENFIQLKDTLADLKKNGGLTNLNNGDNYYEISINVDEIGSDYDVDKLADRLRTLIYRDGQYRNVNTLNRLR